MVAIGTSYMIHADDFISFSLDDSLKNIFLLQATSAAASTSIPISGRVASRSRSGAALQLVSPAHGAGPVVRAVPRRRQAARHPGAAGELAAGRRRALGHGAVAAGGAGGAAAARDGHHRCRHAVYCTGLCGKYL